MVKTYTEPGGQSYPFDVINRIPGRTSRAVAEHVAILDRMAAGDVAGAVQATRLHIETGWMELRDGAGESRDGSSAGRFGSTPPA
jgi:DNA-binding GntR family transcriptional regulator